MVIERVTAVQHPTVAGVDSDAVMAAGMAGHRDEDYPFRDLIEFLGRGDPRPLLSVRVVLDDLRVVRLLGWTEANLPIGRCKT